MTNLIERRENMAKQPAMHNFIVVVAVLVVVVVVVGLAFPKFIFSSRSLSSPLISAYYTLSFPLFWCFYFQVC